MKIEELLERRQLRRKPQGIAAALLPYDSTGQIAVDAFQRHLTTTHQAGLQNAVNMDTGYVNYLDATQKQSVLRWTREALGPSVPFVAGAYIEAQLQNENADIIDLYRREMDRIAAVGAIPILFQSARLHGKSSQEIAAAYRAICKNFSRVLAFELGSVFAPNGEIWDQQTVRLLMDIPELAGMKHSSLDRPTELARLALRDAHRPEFQIFTGNDLGINMIEYGSDYLLGLATFAPEKFAERDRLWAAADPAYYALSDALQHLGNVAFRHPIPAYKHSAAIFLHLTGRIPTDLPHPQCHQRPSWEREILQDCARRLGLETRTQRGQHL